MRITIFLCLISVIQSLAFSSFGQVKVTLKMKNTTIEEALLKMEESTNFRFFYQSKDLVNKQLIDVEFEQKTVLQILDEVLPQLQLKYEVFDNYIAIKSIEDGNSNQKSNQVQKSVSGKVTDSKGSPLPGVTVVVEGTTQGTITDADGNYSLKNLKEDATLVFSFVGMKNQEIPVAGKTTINITLAEETIGIEEVVAVGYGTQKRINLTGAVSSVKIAQLEKKTVSQTSQALAGEISGVTVRQSSGKPGDDEATITIRGMGTFSSAGNSPLVIIDGFVGSLNSVNPNNIESISVLKDAASASIYGSRAANGVILVTTKQGSIGQTRISYNAFFGKQAPTNLPEYVDSWIYAEALNEARLNMGQGIVYSQDEIEKFKSGVDPDNYPNKAHYKDLMSSGNGFVTKNNVTISGGIPSTKYLFSVGYLKQNGIVAENYYNRYDFDLNLNQKINKNINLTVKVSGFQSDNHEPISRSKEMESLYGIVIGSIRNPNSIPGRKSDGSYGYVEYQAPEAFMDSKSFSTNLYKSFTGNIKMEWDVTNSFKITGRSGYVLRDENLKKFMPEIIINPTIKFTPSMLSESYTNSSDLTSELFFNYNKNFEKANFSFMGGISQEEFNNKWIGAYRDDFPNDLLYEIDAGSAQNMQNNGSAATWKLRSVFGRLNYSFNNKYFLEANFRLDGSSRFAKGNRYGFFPSFSGGWRISEEKFMKQFSWLDNLKLRTSWGELGNQQIGTYPYQNIISLGANYPLGDVVSPGAALTSYPFTNISWETTRIFNTGLDISILKGKLNLVGEYFIKNTYGILYKVSASQVLGLSTSEKNAGELCNRGWEFELTYNGNIGKLKYSFSPNISIISNEIKRIEGSGDDIAKGLFVGYPIRSIYGYVSDGLFVDEEDISTYATQNYLAKPGLIRYKDISGPDGVPDGKVDATYDRKVIGSTIPKFIYGASITANYKGIDFYAQLQGMSGHVNTPQGQWVNALFNHGNVQKWQWENRWTKENPDRYAKYPRLEEAGVGSPVFDTPSTYWLYNASFIRLKNIQIGYTFPDNMIPSIEKIRIYVGGTNLITFDNYQKGWDPEMNLTSGHYSPLMEFTFGLNVNF